MSLEVVQRVDRGVSARSTGVLVEPGKVPAVPAPEELNHAWVAWASAQLRAEKQRNGETPLLVLRVPRYADAGIDFYFKDESAHPTGSLKHGLASALFNYALCNGLLQPGRPVVEASSGSTAVSESYFAREIDLPYIAVMPKSTSAEKVELIRFYGGTCQFVDHAAEVYATAQRIATEMGGFYIDQFSNAERAIDWRTNNIADSIFKQLGDEKHPIPAWIVAAAGTGGTSATIGRYLRHRGVATKLCVADPAGSVFKTYWESGNPTLTSAGSKIEGIGRPRVEPSFMRNVVDRMIAIADQESIAGMRTLSALLSRKVGASTGTNFFALIQLAEEMLQSGRSGSLVSIICDSGDRYAGTYYNETWLREKFGDCEQETAKLMALVNTKH